MATSKSAHSTVFSSIARVATLTVVISLPILGVSGLASARITKAAKTVSAKCAKHPKKASCKGSAGSGGAGGDSSSPITVTVSPDPLVETAQSEVHAVIQVQANPSLAGDEVEISSSQLDNSCFGPIFPGAIGTGTGITLFSISDPGGSAASPIGYAHSIDVFLDDDGNAAVTVVATDCAPGESVIEADLLGAPYVTALTTLVANPPVVTPAGLTGSPNPEVETGDNTVTGSDVYAVFYVETSPVYAEQPVTISSEQLQQRCGAGWLWSPGNTGTTPFSYASSATPGTTAETTLDDDGNAVFVFYGASCAAGNSEVLADIQAGDHQTFTATYTISAPTPPGPPLP
jgi:hypothetical protein